MYVRVWDPIERFLSAVTITFIGMCALLYILRGRKRENYTERLMMYGIACLFIGFAVSFFFEYLRVFAIPGYIRNFTYYGDYDKVGSTYKILSQLVYVSGAVAFTFFVIVFEASVKRTKFILTICSIIIVVIIIVLPYEQARLFHHIIFSPFRIILLVIIFYLLAKWSQLEFKAVASFILLGIGVITLGSAINSQDITSLNVFPLFIYSPVIILGAFLAILPLIIDPKYFTQALTLWKLNGAIGIALIFGFYIFYVYYYGFFFYQSLFFLLLGLVVLYIFYRLVSIIKNEQLIESGEISKEKAKEKKLDILGTFTKPQKITEEEVSISKERKICLVCKGKVSGINFLCRECESFYCEKCYNALTGMENLCWACEAVLDESKPFKRLEKEEKEIRVDEKFRKEKL